MGATELGVGLLAAAALLPFAAVTFCRDSCPPKPPQNSKPDPIILALLFVSLFKLLFFKLLLSYFTRKNGKAEGDGER